METKNEEMDVAYTPLSPFFEENVTKFVKSEFWSIFFPLKTHTQKKTNKNSNRLYFK